MNELNLESAIKRFNNCENVSLFYDKEENFLFIEHNDLVSELMDSSKAFDYIQVFMKKEEDDMRNVNEIDVARILEMFDVII